MSLRNISVGAIASQGTEIATISDVSTIKLDFPVPETLISLIRPGLPIQARTDAWPDVPFNGTIHTIDPVADAATRSVVARARIPNPQRQLRPGMLLTVTIENRPRLAVSVPELAVVGEGESRFVYTIDAEGKARRRQVRTGTAQGGRIEIVEGLRPGERVITEGIVKVSEGMPVRVQGREGEGRGGSSARGQSQRGGNRARAPAS